eukprot:SAG22_NODE_542_length_9294_cov_156.554649_12_plen_811_part_00
MQFFQGLIESLSPGPGTEAPAPATRAELQAVDLLAADIDSASAACERVESAFSAVALGVYKSSKGTAYYDTAAEVEQAQQHAATHMKRVQVAAEGTSKLLSMYNAFVPWVLEQCRGRIQELSKLVADTRTGRGGKAAASAVRKAREQSADIVRAIQCLEANVNEARTFLGKVGKTEEGAHDAADVELAGADMIEASTARRSKQKRALAGGQPRSGAAAAGRRSAVESQPRLCDDKVFFQRQRGAFCGVCALNNMLGRREISYRQAELLADSIWLRSVLSHGCGVHFPAPRLHSRRREFPFDGFIDFATMHKLCLLHGLRLRELSRTDAAESVEVMRLGLAQAARQGANEAAATSVVPLLLVLLGSQKHYVCLCARHLRNHGGAGGSGSGSSSGSSSVGDCTAADDDQDADWDDLCRLCGRSGELICCDGDGCTQAYHARCIHFQPAADELWLCPDCRTKKTTHRKMGDSFVHEAELVWMDSQIERPISERMLAVDRRAAGRNAGLFDNFVHAARAAEQAGGLDHRIRPGTTKTPATGDVRVPKPAKRSKQQAKAAGGSKANKQKPEPSEWQEEHEYVGARARHYLGGAVFNGCVAGARALATAAPSRRVGAKRDRPPLVFRFDIDEEDDEHRIGFIELEERDAREAIDAAIALKFHNGKSSDRGNRRAKRSRVPGSAELLAGSVAGAVAARPGASRQGGGGGGGAIDDLRKLLHPSSPEQIVVFAVTPKEQAGGARGGNHDAGIGTSLEQLFSALPNEQIGHSQLSFGGGSAIAPKTRPRSRRSRADSVSSPQLRSIASASPFRDTFRLD